MGDAHPTEQMNPALSMQRSALYVVGRETVFHQPNRWTPTPAGRLPELPPGPEGPRAGLERLPGSPSQLIQVPRPVVFQQARQRAVGEDPASGLASWTVVRLIVGVADSLHGRTAHGTGFPEPAVHRHPRTERGHLLGEAVARLGAQAIRPLEEHLTRGGEEPLGLVLLQLLGQGQRREAGAMEDLVGIGVADPAEEMRIGQCAFERVVPRSEDGIKRFEGRPEQLEPARIDAPSRRLRPG